jgi:regulator of protease activity HflC (stomatin/prohibitin superfamily)
MTKETATTVGIVGVIVAAVIAVITGIFLWANSVNVGAGEEVVLVKQPLLFGAEGVDPAKYSPGRVFTAPTTRAINVNMQPLQFELEFKDMMTSDGVPIDFHAALRVQITDSVQMIKDFGEKWYDRNVRIEFQNQIRQAVRQHGMNETAILTTAVDAINDKVHNAMVSYFKETNLPLKLIAVTMGRANPPDAIKNQRIETANQQQRVVSEKQRKLAEDQRKDAETSRANADNAYRNAMGLNPDQFIQLQQISMMRDACGRHIDELPQLSQKEKEPAKTAMRDMFTVPCTFIVNGSSLATTLNVPAK